jgi:toxin ParE1/3/4
MESRLKSAAPTRIRWTEKSFQYLEAAVLHVATDSPQAAEALARKIHSSVQALALHPQIGRPGRCRGTRELVISGTPYIVPYRVHGEYVEILRVLHGAKKWPQKF